jgi:hypothetical protein
VSVAVDVWTDPDLAELVREDAALVAVADALVEGAQARAWAGDRRRRRAPIVIAAALVTLVVALAPTVALSKSLRSLIGLGAAPIPRGPQVHATLTRRVPVHARPGTRIRISWTLWAYRDNGKVVPVDSFPTFVRIVNPTRTAATTAAAHGKHGRYSATILVPPGGIGNTQIGIIVERFRPTGIHPARSLLPISNAP